MGTTKKKCATAREKPAMKKVINFIEKAGPVTIETLKRELPMSETVIYRACKNGQDEGYLTLKLEKKVGVTGRPHWTYTRTAKRYTPPAVTEKTIRNRVYKERAKERETFTSLGIFRHPQDIALFGEANPCEPKITRGRIYRQPMPTFDEELEAA
jgi:predicted transcriptional regulator